MATTTIQSVSLLSSSKSAPAHSGKLTAFEGAESFRGFLRKSSQPEKTAPIKSEKKADALSAEAGIQATEEKKPEASKPKTSEKTMISDSRPSEAKPEKETTEISAEEEKKLKQFVEKIQKILGLDGQELQMWLNVSGMQPTDLLQAGKMQQFFMQVKGIDVSQLLTEAKPSLELKELLAAVSEAEPLMQQTALSSGEREAFEQTFRTLLGEAEHKQEGVGGADTSVTASENLISTETPALSGQMTEIGPDDRNGKEQSQDKQDLPKEAMPIFEKVVQHQEQIRVTADGLERVTTTVSAKDIYQQIVTKFTAANIDGTSKLTLQLNPEHLGKIAFQVVSREGQVTGQFVAESEAVKAVLEAQVSQLKLHLIDQGIRVEDVKVLVGDTASYFTEDRPKEQNHEPAKKRSKRQHDGITIAAVEEERAEEITVSTGTIDFTA